MDIELRADLFNRLAAGKERVQLLVGGIAPRAELIIEGYNPATAEVVFCLWGDATAEEIEQLDKCQDLCRTALRGYRGPQYIGQFVLMVE